MEGIITPCEVMWTSFLAVLKRHLRREFLRTRRLMVSVPRAVDIFRARFCTESGFVQADPDFSVLTIVVHETFA